MPGESFLSHMPDLLGLHLAGVLIGGQATRLKRKQRRQRHKWVARAEAASRSHLLQLSECRPIQAGWAVGWSGSCLALDVAPNPRPPEGGAGQTNLFILRARHLISTARRLR